MPPLHIVQNERTVTLSQATARSNAYYVVQIGARTVNGIDSYFSPGEEVARGQTFGMIRIGSQVDLIVPWRAEFETWCARRQGARGETRAGALNLAG
jgi:phosphatidylserine decarboxylase